MKKPEKQPAGRRQLGLAAATFFAATVAWGATNEAERVVKAGADLRLRYDVTQGLPTNTRGEAPHSDYARIRIRPWIDIGPENWGLYARLADEFRYYRRPESKNRKQRFPDVVFIDNLYWRQSEIFDLLDLQIGRQDMTFALTGCEWLKDTRFVLQGEYFEKGDYFADGSDGPALFGRCELSWKF